ncbi:hypothetical protein Daura_24065 [Dactylosporangium aurantiacum]|uniref:Uncharacterized protein n=1 Tax=Dactylosporangium aurantiacum TaxID=35754 RepID=A0A9Q9IPP4_9ACTN|nr:hypothetical protein [Dactylosporangium aurantiacum]MDG6103832.1 hypothetical protein [Dactylosporangium aurantiacum]UWZ58968.1 hypothetical protein Daura_24065 [Dactylosporangium aurantiacum]
MVDEAEPAAWHEEVRSLTGRARAMLAAGAGADAVAAEPLRHTDSRLQAIKAVADATGGGLAEAKLTVHRNLDPATREETEAFHQELHRAFERER